MLRGSVVVEDYRTWVKDPRTVKLCNNITASVCGRCNIQLTQAEIKWQPRTTCSSGSILLCSAGRDMHRNLYVAFCRGCDIKQQQAVLWSSSRSNVIAVEEPAGGSA